MGPAEERLLEAALDFLSSAAADKVTETWATEIPPGRRLARL
jgi:hypothetical protein